MPAVNVSFISAPAIGGISVLAQQQRNVIGGRGIGDMELHRDFEEETLLLMCRKIVTGFKNHPIVSRLKGLCWPKGINPTLLISIGGIQYFPALSLFLLKHYLNL
jgi:hypothetical protein